MQPVHIPPLHTWSAHTRHACLRFWPLVALLFSSALSAANTPPLPGAQVIRNAVSFQARPGSVSASRNGRDVWRQTGPLKKPTQLGLWASAREVVLLSGDASNGYVLLSAYDPATGRPKWTRRIVSGPYASAAVRGSVGRTLVLSTLAGEPMAGGVVGLDLNTGHIVWKARQDLVGLSGTEALIIDLGMGAQPMNSPHLLPLTRIEVQSGRRSSLTLTLPVRLGCGPMNYNLDESIPALRFTAKYLYALRQDSCGQFIGRIDWHGSATQVPLIYRDARPSVTH